MIARVGAGLAFVVFCAFAHAGPAGVIVDAQWNPVADADVVLVLSNWRGWGEEILEKTTSEKDGRFAFDRKIEDKWHPTLGDGVPSTYGLFARHPTKGAVLRAFAPIRDKFVTVQLIPLQTCSFRVTNEEGEPVPDANVFLHCAGPRPNDDVRLYTDAGLCTARTDGEGQVTVAGPPEAQWNVQKQGYVPTVSWRAEDTVLCRGARIEGQVLDPDGKPVPNALVECKYWSRSYNWSRAVCANDQGEYVLECVAASGFRYQPHHKASPGNIYLRAYDAMMNSPFLPAKAKVTLQPGESARQDIQLRSSPLLTVRVFDSNTKQPAEGIRFIRYGETDLGGYPQKSWFITNLKGEFRCPALAEFMSIHLFSDSDGGYFIDPRWDDPRELRYDALKSSVCEWHVPLLPTQTVKGRVRDTQGAPLPGAEVYGVGGRCLADEQGYFSSETPLSDRATKYFAFSPDKKWAGFITVPPGQTEVAVTVKPTRTLRGRVVDPYGSPAGSIKFRWARTSADIPPSEGIDHGSDVETAEDGSFVIEHVSPDLAYVACINRHVGQWIPPLGDKDNITLTLRPFTRTVTGRLVDESGNPVLSQCVYMSWYTNGRKSTETDGQGRFTLKNMPIGPTYLAVFTEQFRHTLVSVGADQNDVEVVLRKNAELRFRVLNEDNQPLANVQVVVHEYEKRDEGGEAANYSLVSDGNGEVVFCIPRGREGCYFVAEFRAEKYPLAFVTVGGSRSERKGKNCSVDVVLRTGKPWRGQVVDVEGSGIPNAEVRVMRCEYRSGMAVRCWLGEDRDDLVTRTDAQGYWTFPQLSQDDSIMIRVRAEGFEEKQEELWPDLIQERKTVLDSIRK